MPQLNRRDMTLHKTLCTAVLPSSCWLVSAASLALLMLPSGEALAAGISVATFGGEHGHPTTSNPTALYYNPAGIAESKGIHLYLDGTLLLRSASYTSANAADKVNGENDSVDFDEPTDAKGANYGGEASMFNVAAAPMIGATAKFGDLAVGAGFYVPFGGTAIWDKNDDFKGNTTYPGAEDGIQRWYIIEGSIRSSYLTLAAAYRIEPIRLSLGLSGNLILSTINTAIARNSTGSNYLPSEGRALLDVDGLSASFGAGAVFEAIPKQLWVGLSYQARPNIAGGMSLEGTLKTKFGRDAPTEQDVKLTQDLPDIIRLGARYRPSEAIELRLFGDLARWSAFKDQCISDPDADCEVKEDGSAEEGSEIILNIPRRWKDTFGVHGGVSYFAKEWVELFAGFSYDGNAVPDSTLEPTFLDFHKLSAAIGGRFQVADPLHVGLSYTHVFCLERDNTGESELSAYKPPSVFPDAGGVYTQTVGIINANVDVEF